MQKLYVLDRRRQLGDPKAIYFYVNEHARTINHFSTAVLAAEEVAENCNDAVFIKLMQDSGYNLLSFADVVVLDAASIRGPLHESVEPVYEIVVLKNVTVYDGYGKARVVTASISRSGYIPDLYVRYSGDDDDLYNDGVFINNVMKKLRDIGYSGKNFGRAELGMQDFNIAVLEPGDDFVKWVIEAFGWCPLIDDDDA